MRVAVAGPGDLAKYLVEELLAASHDVVLVTRSPKPWFEALGAPSRITDYSVTSIATAINDCDALISTVLDATMENVSIHLAMLEACKQSPKCKRFIPAEWVGNIEDFPNQPAFYPENHVPIRKELAEQKEVMYTLFCPGWLADYFVPPTSRYLKEIGPYHPIDWAAGTMTIPGTGDEKITFTLARDMAKAVAALISQENWESVTYVSGETSSWNGVAKLLEKHGKVLKIGYRPKALLEKAIAVGSEDESLVAQFEMWSVSGGAYVPQDKVERQRMKFFSQVTFRSVRQLIEAADSNKTLIV